MENKPTQSGVILEDIKPEDCLFGSFGDTTIRVPDGNWIKYLPKNEKQRNGFESMCCTNFSSTTAVEILMTRLIEDKLISIGNLAWLNENGYIDDSGHINFSDRFDAIVSGTTLSGNTLKAPADAKHKYGLIPESMLPWTDNQDEYFKKSNVTTEMYNLGLEFLKRFQINYEFVYPADYQTALRVSPLASACYAWNGTNDGVYYKVSSAINHAICVFRQPDPWAIMDSYEPFQKLLSLNYQFSGHGRTHLFYGATKSSIDNILDQGFTGEGPQNLIMYASVADFNGDNCGDIAVGGWGYPNGTNQGRVWLYYGRPPSSTDITLHWDTTNASVGEYILG